MMLDARHSGEQARRGFTLLELTMSLLIAAVVMVAMGSAIAVAGRAVPRNDGPAAEARLHRQALENLALHLPLATSVTELSYRAIAFTVPDQTGDGAPELFRYAWGGKPGDPLTRQMNAGPPVELIGHLRSFEIEPMIRQDSTRRTGLTGMTSAEIELASFESWPDGPGTEMHYRPTDDSWLAATFSLDDGPVPGHATAVHITRVLLRLRRFAGGENPLTIAIHETDSDGNEVDEDPIGTPVIVQSSALPSSYLWHEIRFADVSVDDDVENFAIVVKGSAGSGGQVGYRYRSDAPADATGARWTSDAGDDWSPWWWLRHRYDVMFHAFGVYETVDDAPSTIQIDRLVAVTARLRAVDGTVPRLESTIAVLNEPEVDEP